MWTYMETSKQSYYGLSLLPNIVPFENLRVLSRYCPNIIWKDLLSLGKREKYLLSSSSYIFGETKFII